jgi:hypothetical protein
MVNVSLKSRADIARSFTADVRDWFTSRVREKNQKIFTFKGRNP